MNKKIVFFLKNIFSSMTVNVVRILITFLLTLVLPKFLGEAEYSYWQLYLFYCTYLAYSSLGWCEGTYIKYGGEEYDALPAKCIAGQFWTLTFYEICFNGIFAVLVSLLVQDETKVALLLFAALSSILDILRYYLQMVLQTTYRISQYAKIAAGERLLFLVFAVLFLILGQYRFVYFVLAELLARLLSLVYAVVVCRKVVFAGLPKLREIKVESKDVLQAGYKLLLAGVAGQLIIGIVRFFIENKWGTLVFGKVSLALSMVHMMVTLLAAVSIVIFPMLKRMQREQLVKVYGVVRGIISACLITILIVYVPIKNILVLWLPQYDVSFKYMALLLPVCIYEICYLVLLSNFFKALRMEKQQLWVNVFCVILSVAGSVVTTYIFQNLEIALVLIVVLEMVKVYVSEYLLGKKMNVPVKSTILWETAMIIAFMGIHWFAGDLQAIVAYAGCLLIYWLVKRKALFEKLRDLKKLVL